MVLGRAIEMRFSAALLLVVLGMAGGDCARGGTGSSEMVTLFAAVRISASTVA